MRGKSAKKSLLAGSLSLAVLLSQNMAVLADSETPETFEYEGTTQISSTDYYPAFDTMSTALTVEEIYVDSGSFVQEGDAILKLTEDSYQSALAYYQAAIIRATNDLTNEELTYAQGMQSAEYELELALADEEQAAFVQEQSEAELADTIEEHEEVLTEMEERIEALEDGEYDTGEEAEEGSGSGLSGTDNSGGDMSGSEDSSLSGVSGENQGSDTRSSETLPQETGAGQEGRESEHPAEEENPQGEGSTEDKALEEQINGLKNEAEGLENSLAGYQDTLSTCQSEEAELEEQIKENDEAYNEILSEIYRLGLTEDYEESILSGSEFFVLTREAALVAGNSTMTGSALETAEETYAEPEAVVEEPQIEEPQVEEPQIEEPQVEEPQIEEPQYEEPQMEEQLPEEISDGNEADENSAENDGSDNQEETEEEDKAEDETESETEEWDGMFDPEHPERGGLLIAQISGGTITMEIPENTFSEAVSLQISELTASYEALISGAVDAEDTALLYSVLNEAYAYREGSWEDTEDQIYDFYVLNLSFVNQSGARVEPAAAIQVSVDHSADPVHVGASEADMGYTTEDLFRISPASGQAESVGSQIGLSDNRISSLIFTADSFASPYVLLMIETAKEEEETETETETESETEEEELSDETEEQIKLLNTEVETKNETQDETEDETEDTFEKLRKEIEEMISYLGNEGDELKELLNQFESAEKYGELLNKLDSLINQLETEGKGGELLDELKETSHQFRSEQLEKMIRQLYGQEEDRQELYREYYEAVKNREEKEQNLGEIEEHINAIHQQVGELEGQVAELEQQQASLAEENETLLKEIEELKEEETSVGKDTESALSGLTQEEALEAAENAASGLSDQTDLSALAGMSGMSGLSGLSGLTDASSLTDFSDEAALQMAEGELAASLGETAVSGEGVLDAQGMLSALESESMFGDKYDLTQAKTLLERKATDADEAEDLLDELYEMQESVQLDYEELLRNRKPLQLEIRYQYDETLLLARLAEITYDQTTKELEEELQDAQETLSDLEEQYQELEDLGDGTIRAAASGTLSAVYYEAEDTLISAFPMYSIYDTDTVTVLIAVPQSEIAQISVGESVEVSLGGIASVSGTVTEKAVEAQEGTSRTTVNYEVEVSIDNSSGRLSSGTAATVTVTEA